MSSQVSIVSSSKDNFIVGVQALHGNPYDGHTLQGAIQQSERLGNFQAEEIKELKGIKLNAILCACGFNI